MKAKYKKMSLLVASCFVPMLAMAGVQSISLSCQADSTGTGGTCQVSGTPLGNLQKVSWVGQNVNMQITSGTQISYQCWAGMPNTNQTVSTITANAITTDSIPATLASAKVQLSCNSGSGSAGGTF